MPPAPCTSGSTMMPAISLGVALEQPRQAPRRCASSVGRSTMRCSGSSPRNSVVHAGVGIAHRHRAGGVAVIAALEGDELGAAADAAVEPVLHRHLHRDLDRDRAGLGEEHAVEIARQQRREPPRQRQRLLVHQPAEHHMRHRRELPLDRLRGYADGCSRGRRSTTRRCRRSARARRRARCGSRRCARPAAAAARSSSAHRAARCARARPRTSRAVCGSPAIQCFQSIVVDAILPVRQHGHPECVRSTNSRQQARRTGSRAACTACWPRPTGSTASGSSATAGGCCRSPATTIST